MQIFCDVGLVSFHFTHSITQVCWQRIRSLMSQESWYLLLLLFSCPELLRMPVLGKVMSHQNNRNKKMCSSFEAQHRFKAAIPTLLLLLDVYLIILTMAKIQNCTKTQWTERWWTGDELCVCYTHFEYWAMS